MTGRGRAYAHVVRLSVLAFVTMGLGGPATALASAPLEPASAIHRGSLPDLLPPASRPSLRVAVRLGSRRALGWPRLTDPGPQVRLVSPAGPRAPVDGVISLAFSEVVDAGLAERSFEIEPAAQGGFEWPDERTLVFRPAALLAYRTTYRVSVASTSLARRRLAAAGSFTFSTVWPPPDVPFPFTLTLDDCGTAAQIQAVLAALADRGLRAIFFPTGICRDQFPWLVPALLAAGHRVCNHTYSHPDLTRLSDSAIRSQIQGGVSAGCELFRPPYGAIDRQGRIAGIAASMGYRVQLWDVDTRDWAGTSAAAMVAMIRARGGVVLMHMHGAHTVEAIQTL